MFHDTECKHWFVKRGLGLILCAALLFPFAKVSEAQAKPKKLQVVIVAVSGFDDPAFHDPLLEQGIAAATTALVNFLGQTFPAANVKVVNSHDDTTDGKLTTFFKERFPSIADGNVTLLFVLSHGEPYPYPNRQYGSDVQIIASDTPKAEVRGKSISLSNDILHYLNGLSPGTLVFGFIDTCYSGGASNFSVALDDATRNRMGVKTMMMVSALSDQVMFQGGFTEALVHLWSQADPAGRCTVPEQSTDSIRDEIAKTLSDAGTMLGQTEGYPAVLIHFQGLFCLESFAADSALVAIYNAGTSSYRAVFTDQNGHTFGQMISGNDTTPLRLTRAVYEMDLFQDNQQVAPPKKLDLSADPLDYEVIGNANPDPSQVGHSLEETIKTGQTVGIPEDNLNQLRKNAFVAFTIAKENVHAARLAHVLDKSGDKEWQAARALASKSTAEIKASIPNDDPKGLEIAARQLAIAGQLERSAELYRDAATAVGKLDHGQQNYLGTQAYRSFTAAGNHATAQDVMHKFKLPANDICEGCGDLGKMAAKGNQAASSTMEQMGGSKMVVGMAEGPSKSSEAKTRAGDQAKQ